MRPDPAADRKYMIWAVNHYRCAVRNRECCRVRTWAPLTASPVPAKGSGIVLCRVHKDGQGVASLASVGTEGLERVHDLNMHQIARWLQMVHDGEMLFGDPPKGVYSV